MGIINYICLIFSKKMRRADGTLTVFVSIFHGLTPVTTTYFGPMALEKKFNQ
jgi:hypothetical protein